MGVIESKERLDIKIGDILMLKFNPNYFHIGLIISVENNYSYDVLTLYTKHETLFYTAYNPPKLVIVKPQLQIFKFKKYRT